MVRRILLQLAFALPLLAVSAFAQDVNWVAILHAAGGAGGPYSCLPLQSANYQGQPADISKGAGLSMEICPYVYYNSGDYGEVFIQVPPNQPWNPNPDWYQWNVPTNQVQRGTPTATSDVWTFTQEDTFDVLINLTWYTVWPQQWHGVLDRTLQLHERCGRWPCRNYVPYAQCVPAKGCFVSFSDISDVATLTGTFPVPMAP